MCARECPEYNIDALADIEQIEALDKRSDLGAKRTGRGGERAGENPGHVDDELLGEGQRRFLAVVEC
jgi:hypothetical protein